jgi:hypothetical protein
MKKNKILRALFLLLLATNLVIYFFRDHFSYYNYVSSHELYGTCNLDCIEKWKQAPADYHDADLIIMDSILDKNIGSDGLPVNEQVLAIGGFIYERFHQKTGRPSVSLLQASPLDQFIRLENEDSSRIWCGIYASIFNYFCWSRNIPCRTIEFMIPGNHHVVNEFYSPEINDWVMVDLTSNILLTQKHDSRPLSLLSFIKSLENKERLYSFSAVQNGIHMDTLGDFENKHFYGKENEFYYYHRVNNEKIYSVPAKLKRYLLPTSFYSIFKFSKSHHRNILFYIKLFFIYSLISVLIAIIYRKISDYRKI